MVAADDGLLNRLDYLCKIAVELQISSTRESITFRENMFDTLNLATVGL